MRVLPRRALRVLDGHLCSHPRLVSPANGRLGPSEAAPWVPEQAHHSISSTTRCTPLPSATSLSFHGCVSCPDPVTRSISHAPHQQHDGERPEGRLGELHSDLQGLRAGRREPGEVVDIHSIPKQHKCRFISPVTLSACGQQAESAFRKVKTSHVTRAAYTQLRARAGLSSPSHLPLRTPRSRVFSVVACAGAFGWSSSAGTGPAQHQPGDTERLSVVTPARWRLHHQGTQGSLARGGHGRIGWGMASFALLLLIK